jgi:hypothetical protein
VELARRQLRDLADVSDGAVQFLKEETTSTGADFLISLDTSGITPAAGGIDVRARERFEVSVTAGFPFDHPSVWSVHRRWVDTPHVQWGRHLCLYQVSAVEWDPADGMRGLITRLSEWVERAVAGTLDPDGQPLHPPAVYMRPSSGRVLVHPDLGDRVPWAADGTGAAAATVFAWCTVSDRRIDVIEWIDQATAA